jgi:hypothetical protein
MDRRCRPASRDAIGALARRDGWHRREIRARGGVRLEYHFALFCHAGPFC